MDHAVTLSAVCLHGVVGSIAWTWEHNKEAFLLLLNLRMTP